MDTPLTNYPIPFPRRSPNTEHYTLYWGVYPQWTRSFTSDVDAAKHALKDIDYHIKTGMARSTSEFKLIHLKEVGLWATAATPPT